MGIIVLYSSLLISAFFSVLGFAALIFLIPRCKHAFVAAGLRGKDMAKKSSPVVPEALGILVAGVYLVLMFIFIPIAFKNDTAFQAEESGTMKQFISQLAALLSICCMVFLGMSDDIFDLRWRVKLFLPTVASLPLLMVYYVTYNLTLIIVPIPLRGIFGTSIDIGLLYYLYMGLLAIFCSNSVNILAGINGLEVGQSVVIALSVLVFNLVELFVTECAQPSSHQLSIYLLLPFLGCSLALLKYNWYPAQVFVGDTYCYFAGMLFAVVGILGHFSKTLLLMFIPQIFNFVYSVPQLLLKVPCPRHRLPKYNAQLDKSVASVTQFQMKQLSYLDRAVLFIFRKLGLLQMKVKSGGGTNESDVWYECNNLTLINLVLIYTGPMREDKLCMVLLVIQVLCSCVAFTIRYPLAHLFYSTS